MRFDTQHRVVDRPPLKKGDRVYIRDMNREAEVVAPAPEIHESRSYVVQSTQDNNTSVVRRNRCSLTALPPSSKDQSECRVSSFGRVIRPRERLDL